VFSLKKRVTIKIEDVSLITTKKKSIIITVEKTNSQYFISNLHIPQNSAFEFLVGVWKQAGEVGSLKSAQKRKAVQKVLPAIIADLDTSEQINTNPLSSSEIIPHIEASSNNSLAETNSNSDRELENPNKFWEEFISGSESTTYKSGAVIASENDITQGRLYYITSGKCYLESKSRPSVIVSEDTTFGQVDFLLGLSTHHPRYLSTAVAAVDDTAVTLIEPYFLNILFQYHPQYAGSFFFLLGQALYEQLQTDGQI